MASSSATATRAANVTDADSAVDCSLSTTVTAPHIVSQFDLPNSKPTLRIAIIQCDADSSEFVESFVAATDAWASNGLVAGPDVAFTVTGECTANETTVACPASIWSEDDSTVPGSLIISTENNDPKWEFTPN